MMESCLNMHESYLCTQCSGDSHKALMNKR